jgi:peptide/nickel transport system permease protein
MTQSQWRTFKLPRINLPLASGSTIIIVLVLGALFAPLIAPYGPNEAVPNLGFGFKAYPPGTANAPLGTDNYLRDLFSRLLYGGRLTLLFAAVAAVCRIIIGTVLGMLAGWYRCGGRIINVMIGVSSAVPSLIFALLPIGLVNRQGGIVASTVTFLIVLSLTGWAEAAVRTRTAVQGLRQAQFVESAYTVGLTRAQVLWSHVLPNLRDLLVVEFAYAMSATLLLVAELAFLGAFVGGAESELLGDRIVLDPVYAEWGSMLAVGLGERRNSPWLLLIPVAAFTLAILAFNLLAEGLRRRRT